MGFLIPIAFFVATAYTIKVIVEARVRSKMLAANASAELLASMVLADENQRRLASLRWGIILIGLAIGFLAIEFFDWRDAGPGAVGVLLGLTGIGNLISYAMSKRLESPATPK